jgi:type IV secretory pathway VirB4 component
MISPRGAAAQNTLFPPARFVSENVFVTKTGELGVVLSLRGVDADWRTDAMVDDLHADLATAFRSIPEGFRVHQYFVKTDGAELEHADPHPDPIVEQTVARRLEFLQSSVHLLCRVRIYLAIVYEPKTLSRKLRLTGKSKSFEKETLDKNIQRVTALATVFLRNAGALLGAKLLRKQEIFRFFRFLASLDDATADAETLVYDNNVDHWMSSVPITVHPQGIRLNGRPIETLTLRRLPQSTWPVLLRDLLSVKGDFLICHEFARQSSETASKAISEAEDHYKHAQFIRNLRGLISLAVSRGKKEQIVPDQGMVAKLGELGEMLVRLNYGDAMGYFSFTGLFWGAEAATAVSAVQKIFGAHDGAFTAESYWALGAYLSCIPGSVADADYRQRQQWIYLSQYVDLGLFHAHDSGNARNEHLDREALLPLRTVDDTVYYFNSHTEDLMGDLIIGESGSGKSVFTNLRIDASMRYNPETLILDGLGGSYRTLTRKHGGNYFELDPDGNWAFTLNPCALPDSRKNRQHLAMLIRSCLASGGYKTNARRNQIIFEAVRNLYELPAGERRFSALQLPEDMALYFAPWVADGQYSFIFDNERDTFELSRFQTIDFSAMDAYPDVLQSLLYHFFFLWDGIVNDPRRAMTFKQMYVDEGWKMISYKAARRYIQAAGRTWRKRNGGVVLVTQSIEELRDAEMLKIVRVLCPRTLLLATQGANFEDYAQVLHLNERGVAEARALRGKGQILEIVGGRAKRLMVDIDPVALWTYASSPRENAMRDKAIREFGFEEGLRRLAAGAA